MKCIYVIHAFYYRDHHPQIIYNWLHLLGYQGMNANEGNLDLAEILSSETASNAARLFLSYINSTTTISASYALVIILGISLALLSLLGLAYAAASAIFTGK